MAALAPPAVALPSPATRTIGVKRSHKGENLKSTHAVSEGTLTADGNRVWPEEYGIRLTYKLPPGLPPGLIIDASALHLISSAEKLKPVDKRKYQCGRVWKLLRPDGSGYDRTKSRHEAAAFLATHGFSFVDLVAGADAPALPAEAEITDVCISTPAMGQSKRVRPTPADMEDFDGRMYTGTCENLRSLLPKEPCPICKQRKCHKLPA